MKQQGPLYREQRHDGERLRDWMDVDEATFYDRSRIAIVPMAFCFPGYSAAGADLPPPRICADTVASWRQSAPGLIPLPHPSWRNSGWLKRHPWFETELLPELRRHIADLL